MNWIKVVLFIILVAVAIGLFLYTHRKEQKRKPKTVKAPVGVSTHLHRDVFDDPSRVEIELVRLQIGNEAVLEVQSHTQ